MAHLIRRWNWLGNERGSALVVQPTGGTLIRTVSIIRS